MRLLHYTVLLGRHVMNFPVNALQTIEGKLKMPQRITVSRSLLENRESMPCVMSVWWEGAWHGAHMSFSSVDFPVPFGPTSATRLSKSTPRSTYSTRMAKMRAQRPAPTCYRVQSLYIAEPACDLSSSCPPIDQYYAACMHQVLLRCACARC